MREFCQANRGLSIRCTSFIFRKNVLLVIFPVVTLTVSAPVLFGWRYIAPLVNAYAQRYPDVVVNAVYADRTTRPLEDGVDIAIRIGHLEDILDIRGAVGFCTASNLRDPGLSRGARGARSSQGARRSPLCVLHRRDESVRVVVL